jgi:hypothetical protein
VVVDVRVVVWNKMSSIPLFIQGYYMFRNTNREKKGKR